jgi:predicted RNA-binding protein with PIN domain
MRIVYAGPGHTADDRIIALLRECGDPRRVLVVSSDRQVRRDARRLRARTLSSEVFLEQLARDIAAGMAARARPRHSLRGDEPLDAHAVAFWLRYFGFDAPDAAPTRPAHRAPRP